MVISNPLWFQLEAIMTLKAQVVNKNRLTAC